MLFVHRFRLEKEDLGQRLLQYKLQNDEVIKHTVGLKTRFTNSMEMLKSYQEQVKDLDAEKVPKISIVHLEQSLQFVFFCALFQSSSRL